MILRCTWKYCSADESSVLCWNTDWCLLSSCHEHSILWKIWNSAQINNTDQNSNDESMAIKPTVSYLKTIHFQLIFLLWNYLQRKCENNFDIVSNILIWTFTELKQLILFYLEKSCSNMSIKYYPSGFWGMFIYSSLNHHFALYHVMP